MNIIELERIIKFIFNKPVCSDSDIQLGNYYIKQWKKLTGWKEDTAQVITFKRKSKL